MLEEHTRETDRKVELVEGKLYKAQNTVPSAESWQVSAPPGGKRCTSSNVKHCIYSRLKAGNLKWSPEAKLSYNLHYYKCRVLLDLTNLILLQINHLPPFQNSSWSQEVRMLGRVWKALHLWGLRAVIVSIPPPLFQQAKKIRSCSNISFISSASGSTWQTKHYVIIFKSSVLFFCLSSNLTYTLTWFP
jgi:hypothetical protein